MNQDTMFAQLEFVRKMTLKVFDEISEDIADQIPAGFRNNIRWNLGHIFITQERFAFHFTGQPMHLPPSFEGLFARGSSPADWKSDVPNLAELKTMMSEQISRIRDAHDGRTDEAVTPYTTSSGMTLSTIGDFLNFNLYHEGVHFSVIKTYKKLLSNAS